MTKLTVPPSDFKTELTPGKLPDAIKALSAAKIGEMIRVPVDNIKVLDGFNVRVRETEDYKQGIAELQQSIAENGFYVDKPLAGYVATEDGKPILYVRDGHRRLEAVEAHNFEATADAKIETLPVVVVPAATTMEEHLVNLVQSNSGKDLTPFEKGLVVKRLVGFGMDKKTIALKLGFTPRYIDDLLVIVAAPSAARSLILENKVSSTQALRELRKDPAKAAAALTAMVRAAQDKGKAKGTASDKGPKMTAIKVTVNFGAGDIMGATLGALAAAIREVVPHLSKEEGDAIQTDGSLALTIHTLAVEAPKPAAKPKAEKAPAAPKEKVPAKAKPDKKAAAKKTVDAAKEAGLIDETPKEEQEVPDELAHALGAGSPPATDDALADL